MRRQVIYSGIGVIVEATGSWASILVHFNVTTMATIVNTFISLVKHMI